MSAHSVSYDPEVQCLTIGEEPKIPMEIDVGFYLRLTYDREEFCRLEDRAPVRTVTIRLWEPLAAQIRKVRDMPESAPVPVRFVLELCLVGAYVACEFQSHRVEAERSIARAREFAGDLEVSSTALR